MSDSSAEFHYKTDFNLTNPVTDLEAAREYLRDHDATFYFKNDDYGIDKQTRDDVFEVSWELENESSGYIIVKAWRELYDDELADISSWIAGQCSDGIGEGFEQQDFASYTDDEYYRELNNFYTWAEDDEEEPNEDDYFCMASFDWSTNDYALEKCFK